MRRTVTGLVRLGIAVAALSVTHAVSRADQTSKLGGAPRVPQFQFDPSWPKQPFPNYEIIGNVIGLAIDAKEHVWVLHRPQMVTEQEQGAAFGRPEALCCRPAKPVLDIDPAGNVVQEWGGPGAGYTWVSQEHGIFVDHKDNVWIGSPQDSHLLKFTRNGMFLMQIGEPGHKEPTSRDPKILGGPAPFVDATTNELFVADGYRNRRVIVFDADTGAFKRMWGAYGKPPDDSIPWKFNPAGTDVSPSPQFQTVTGVVVSRDNLVYVSDRSNNRIQVFRKDGTFVREGFVLPKTPRGTIDTLAFSPDPEQRFLYDADPRNMRIWILRRADLHVLGWFGHGGHQAGGFVSPAYIVVDAKGNLYVGEGQDGKRVQRFLYKGMGPAANALN
jgi:hypothetical protein